MKTLLILRHAKSSWNNLDLPDYDRPLNKRGKRDAPRMGDFLRHQDLVPDLVISSTAKRAKKTAKLFDLNICQNAYLEKLTKRYNSLRKQICI